MYGRVGQNEYGRGKQVTGNFIFCMPKLKEPNVKRSTFLFFHWNRKNNIDDPVIISSLAFTSETKMSSDSLPHHIHFAPPYPTKIRSVTVANPDIKF